MSPAVVVDCVRTAIGRSHPEHDGSHRQPALRQRPANDSASGACHPSRRREVHLVGGFEHMNHLPLGSEVDPNPKLFRHMSRAAVQMGLTAEHLARKFGISRATRTGSGVVFGLRRTESSFAPRKYVLSRSERRH
jgi:hypothetical protein